MNSPASIAAISQRITGRPIFDQVLISVITWPDDSTGDEYQVARGSNDWNNIFKAYKSVIEGMLPGVTVTDEDVESICVKPYKLTNNNDGYHVDCSVSITCRNLFNARYYVDDPTTPGEGFQLVASKLTYREGDTTDIADFADVSLPPSKTVWRHRVYLQWLVYRPSINSAGGAPLYDRRERELLRPSTFRGARSSTIWRVEAGTTATLSCMLLRRARRRR